MQAQGIPVVPGILATNAKEAVTAAHQFGMPVALKIQSSALAHKSDVGGVLLQLATEEEVRQGFHTLIERMRPHIPAQALQGVLVSPMRPAGTELLVGIIRDPLWELVLALGLGGIWAEALKDTSVRVLPVDRAEIRTMVQELRGAAVLHGARGHAPADMDALADVIYQVSQVALGLQEHLSALEINPLLVSGSVIEALDVLLTWKAPSPNPVQAEQESAH